MKHKGKIRLFCAAGFSTSLVVLKIKEAIQKRGLDLEIEAHSIMQLNRYALLADVILLAPQVHFNLEGINKNYPDVPCAVIGQEQYGRLDGEGILDLALSLMDERMEKMRTKHIIMFAVQYGTQLSMLESRMNKLIAEAGYNLDVEVVVTSKANIIEKKVDVILWEPKVIYECDKIRRMFPGTPTLSIDIRDFALADGQAVLDKALIYLKDI